MDHKGGMEPICHATVVETETQLQEELALLNTGFHEESKIYSKYHGIWPALVQICEMCIEGLYQI